MPGPFYFAWAGATIQPQQVVVTNGTTHGGVLTQISIVGDIGGSQGNTQIRYIASTQDLEIGTLYKVEGPGIADGTYFLYDNSPLAPEGAVNLNTATGTASSVTLRLTKAIVVGDFVGTLTAGSNVVGLGGIDLLPGVYVISGTGIGLTDLPIGTTSGTTIITGGGGGQIIVPAAAFVYSGGGTAQMFLIAATPHTTTGIDSFGMSTSRISYTTGFQEVRAEISGEYPLQIMGMPDSDWFKITGIPATALAELQAGLRYNVSGNGIQVGSTFVAPAPGVTEIEVDLPTSASAFDSLLTITGPRTPDASFDPAIHNRFDEEVLGFVIEHDEGNFATLTIDLKNPGVGLLATGRNLWCWLSWDSAWNPAGNAPNLVPLFNGRLVGVPQLQAGEIVQLHFIARPDDYNAQKEALVTAMSVLPFYDPVWLVENINPDTVLETYSSLWHVDRTTLALTASDIIQGEDGTLTIGEDQAFYDNFTVHYGQPPLISIAVSGTVSWSQQGEGIVDITPLIIKGFHAAGSPYDQAFALNIPGGPGGTQNIFQFAPYGHPIYGGGLTSLPQFNQGTSGGGGLISTLVGEGLKSDWPKPGTNIGGGWSLTTRNDDSGIPMCYCDDATRDFTGGWLQPTYYNVNYAGQTPPASQAGMTQDQSNVNLYMQGYGQFNARFPINVYKVRMTLEYRAARTRTETISAVITADAQRELSDSSDSDREELNLSSQYVGQGIDPGGGIPIADLSARTYFQTPRGLASWEYLLMAARAKLRARARAVDITFAVDFPTALGITLRNSVLLLDRRLPGGSAVGKVKQYRITVGDGGMFGEFTLGATIGNGDVTTALEGTNTWVEDDYVDPGYQVVAGGTVMLVNDELAYQPLDNFVIVDDGVDFHQMSPDRVVNSFFVTNGLQTQLNLLSQFQNTVGPTPYGDPVSVMRTLITKATLDLKPVAGAEFHTNFFPYVSLLALPKTIDLAAMTEVEAMWDVPIGTSIWDDGASTWDQ